MDSTRLFVDTCHELRQRLVESTPHALRRTSLPLRQLLLDDSPLVEQMRRIHRGVEVKFTVALSTIDWDTLAAQIKISPPEVEFLGDQPDGPLPPTFVRQTFDRERFLKVRFGRVRDKHYSVKDVIEYMAYVEGGIHFGQAKDEETIVGEIATVFKIKLLGMDPVYVAMRGIATVTLRAMEPMVRAIEAAVTGS
jgi:hypothetical protein